MNLKSFIRATNSSILRSAKRSSALNFHSSIVLYEKQGPAEEILQIIQCPLSKGKLFYDSSKHEVISLTARIAFLVHDDGVINLCPHDARVMTQEELLGYMDVTEDQTKSQN